jgi:mannose-1-phosphate guanylyltransferase/MurNAc alpha-1-phosphate uridylyltransferase
VANVPLLDLNLARVGQVAGPLAVNVHHLRHRLEEHLARHHPGVYISVEDRAPLGTAGALGRLRDWIDQRPVLVVNGDSWSTIDLDPVLDGWDGHHVRLLAAGGGPFGPRLPLVAALMPWDDVVGLRPEPSGLFRTVWGPAEERGRLEIVAVDGDLVDCGTPASYLAANLRATGGASAVGDGAVVEGEVERSVVWDGATVWAGERLVDAIRADEGVTVMVR